VVFPPAVFTFRTQFVSSPFQVQPRRWVVERTIAWLNRCRRLSKDFEHLAKNSVAWIYWASIQRMLRYLAPPPDLKPPYARQKITLAV
jgi:hypothetical protein